MKKRLSLVVCVLALAAFAAACAQTDAGITTSVKTRLAADDTVKAYEINVDTQNGVVTLSGNVDNAAAKEQAVRVARETKGVTSVVDNLNVAPSRADTAAEDARATAGRATEAVKEEAGKVGVAMTDAAITTAVKSKFLADKDVSGLKIDVDTDGGIVTLTGTVKSSAEKDKAIAIATKTDGVKRVIDQLKVGY